jgi:hydrogenase/urease accessory protein HupE
MLRLRKKYLVCTGIFLSTNLLVHAHPVINYALEGASIDRVGSYYFGLGMKHILPMGLDHILFIVSLCMLSTQLKTIIWQATAFTAAHTITLALTMKNIITVSGNIVEPVIALSIVFVAIENILIDTLRPWRFILIFLFGLIHGMGFANALSETGIPPDGFIPAVLFFNIGVEAGQLIVILLIFSFIILPFRNRFFYRKWIVWPISSCIAVVAFWWTIERII